MRDTSNVPATHTATHRNTPQHRRTGGLDFENAILDGEKRHVKCASSEVENQHVLALFFRFFHLFGGILSGVRRCKAHVCSMSERVLESRMSATAW